MDKRIKKVRQFYGLTQSDFGQRIGVKGNTVTNYENGLRSPSETVLMAISREFGISLEWLKDGTGDMLIPVSRNDEIAMFAADIIKEPDTSFRKRLVEVLAQLNEQQWETLAQIAEMLAKEKE